MTQRNRAIHPFLIAPFPILLLYSRNLHAVDLGDTLVPMALVLLATVSACFTLRACKLDGPRAALIVSMGLILFFSFGHAVKLIGQLGIISSRLGRECSILGIEVLLMAGVVALVLKQPALSRALTGFLNASSAALVVLSLIGIVNEVWAGSEFKPPEVSERPVPVVAPPKGRLPDVYFVVLDAYGRSDVLKELMGFDNSGFLDRLEAKGFFVADRSAANYCQTALSLASSLNLRYLDDMAGNPSDDRLPLKRLIADAAVFRTFRQMGYRLVTFESGFDASESVASDLTLAPSGNLRTFPSMIVNQTPLWLLLGQRDAHEPHRMHRERVLKVFDDLPASNHPSDSPTFTFAHVLSPHPPFLFGANGQDVSEREGAYSLGDSEGWREAKGHGGSAEYTERYRDQVTYITSRLEDTIDRILKSSPVEPIIIIQGDHGPGSHFEASSDEPNDLHERMTVLNAIYLPRDHRGTIDATITPVNTFRLVFDRCFGSKLGLLDDRSYHSPYQKPYMLQDVTSKVDDPED